MNEWLTIDFDVIDYLLIALILQLTEGVACKLSSDKNVYSLRRLVAMVE